VFSITVYAVLPLDVLVLQEMLVWGRDGRGQAYGPDGPSLAVMLTEIWAWTRAKVMTSATRLGPCGVSLSNCTSSA
jgi:hypothetical protein